jgi:hypothetical protein
MLPRIALLVPFPLIVQLLSQKLFDLPHIFEQSLLLLDHLARCHLIWNRANGDVTQSSIYPLLLYRAGPVARCWRSGISSCFK